MAVQRLQQPQARHLELFRRFVLLCDPEAGASASSGSGAGAGAGAGSASAAAVPGRSVLDGPDGEAKLAEFLAFVQQ